MKDNKGFSLVELIVVIAIMAILATVAVVSYSVYIERAQDAADQKYLADVVSRAELFAMENQIQLWKIKYSSSRSWSPPWWTGRRILR